MGKIILELSDKDLLQLGELKIKEKVGQTLKWLKLDKKDFNNFLTTEALMENL